jgi:hypothetical protein
MNFESIRRVWDFLFGTEADEDESEAEESTTAKEDGEPEND